MAGDDPPNAPVAPAAPRDATRKCKAKPREYKEGENFIQYLNHFERVATANEWSDEIKLVQLETVLKGRAQSEFEMFIDETPNITWNNMVKSLKEELCPSIQKSLDDFSNVKMGKMSPKEFYAALVRLSKLAHGDMSAEARHIIVRAQMLQAIPKTLRTDAGKQSYLAGLEKEELLKILTRVYDADLREDLTEEAYEPIICGVGVQPGVMKDTENRLKEMELENLKMKADISEMKNMVSDLYKSVQQDGITPANRNGAMSRQRYPINLAEIKCYRCQKMGHYARTCRNEQVCSRCKQSGHSFTQCSNDPKNL